MNVSHLITLRGEELEWLGQAGAARLTIIFFSSIFQLKVRNLHGQIGGKSEGFVGEEEVGKKCKMKRFWRWEGGEVCTEEL